MDGLLQALVQVLGMLRDFIDDLGLTFANHAITFSSILLLLITATILEIILYKDDD